MKKILHFGLIGGLLAAFIMPNDSFAAAKKTTAKKQSAIQAGTKVRAKVEASGIYDEECYNAYYGCMDQFCIADNENGGSCMCSDDAAKYDEQLEAIKKMLVEAERIGTEEVERVQAGANADIIFNGGERVYNDDGTVAKQGNEKKKSSVSWKSIYDEEDDEDEDLDIDLSDKVGKDLYTNAHKLCEEQMPESCEKDMKILTQMYSRQIISDCKGLANTIAQKKQEAEGTLAKAKAAVRSALKDSLEESNKYDRGTCMVEYKKCMMSADACGSDWGNCVFTIASENMQNEKAKSVAGTTVSSIDTYDITASTMEILESKRFICEKVLDSCVAVRDYVWNDFLREAAPTIRLAESNIESQKRQSCLTDISNCIQKACKDDIVGKGEATMDACLARPDMARSFCKIQIDPCERMEPQIWDYVKSKLAAMRVDVCTQEVKDCVEERCGADFQNCIGMDFAYIHGLCPVDKLVVCKQTKPDFKMSDLDEMLMGFYLNVDNKSLDVCQKEAEKIMTENCGSTTDCNAFASDEYLGTGSLRSQKDGTVYRVTGMISFGSIKMGDATRSVKDGKKILEPGEIGVEDYIEHVKENNYSKGSDGIISSIEEELNNIAGTINRTISLLESNERIQYCITGRDLSQINGKGKTNNTTTARFPNLLNQYRTVIAMAALRKAQDNYNKKLETELTKASEGSSLDVAQFMCNKMGAFGNIDTSSFKEQNSLTQPYAISYDVGTGLTTEALMQGGSATKSEGGGTSNVEFDGGWRKYSLQNSGSTSTRESSFNRSNRVCTICTTTTTKSCNQTIQWSKSSSDCKVEQKEPVCQEIKL